MITGDVIDSGTLENDYRERLTEAFRSLTDRYGDVMPLDVDRYSGDQFQILLDTPSESLEASLFVMSLLASRNSQIFVRVSVGIGEIQTVPEERVSMGDGEAFRLSGTNLERMGDHQRIFIASATEATSLLEGSSDLLSSIVVDWSQQQAEAVKFKLKDWSNSDIADELGISKPSVGDRLDAAEWKYLSSYLSGFNEYWNTQG